MVRSFGRVGIPMSSCQYSEEEFRLASIQKGGIGFCLSHIPVQQCMREQKMAVLGRSCRLAVSASCGSPVSIRRKGNSPYLYPEMVIELHLALNSVQWCISNQKMAVLGWSGRLTVPVSYELLSVSVERGFRLNPETGDRVLSCTQSYPVIYERTKNGDHGMIGMFGCIGSLCAPVRGR